jgi:hypothetical protein
MYVLFPAAALLIGCDHLAFGQHQGAAVVLCHVWYLCRRQQHMHNVGLSINNNNLQQAPTRTAQHLRKPVSTKQGSSVR